VIQNIIGARRGKPKTAFPKAVFEVNYFFFYGATSFQLPEFGEPLSAWQLTVAPVPIGRHLQPHGPSPVKTDGEGIPGEQSCVGGPGKILPPASLPHFPSKFKAGAPVTVYDALAILLSAQYCLVAIALIFFVVSIETGILFVSAYKVDKAVGIVTPSSV
jgi:prepilin signal peptidase PulO-like enzyme (type II secretory pathway)